MIEAALSYLDAGKPIFPVCSPAMGKHEHRGKRCTSPGKVPLVSWEDFQTRLPSKVEAEMWWHRWTDANIGMATGELSGAVVLDCDGGEARKEAQKRGVPETPSVWTGKPGGVHFHLRWPGEPVRNFARKLPGLDFRGDGGYVLLPPSLHATGARYTWVKGTEHLPLAEPPSWLLELLRGRVETTSEVEPREILKLEDLGRIPEGQRNDTLYRMAGKMRGDDVPLRYAEHLIRLEAARCSPAYDETDVVEMVRRAYREYAPRNGRTEATISNGKILPGEIPASGLTARELMTKTFAPTKWIVPGLLPEGGTLLSGKTKLGKSWLMLQVALAVADGGIALGKVRCPPGRVLYLALEDGERRIQDRLAKLLDGAECPERLHIFTVWPRFDEEQQGIKAIEAFLRQYPDTVLVIVDTLKMVRPKEDSRRRIYDLDYEAVAPATQLAQRERIGLAMVHHNNKLRDVTDLFDMISGSTGLTGGVDTGLVLRRESGQADASLGGRGRDLEELDLALRWGEEGYGWALLGDMEDHRISVERKRLLEVIRTEPGLQAREIAELADQKRGSVRRLLFSMAHDGQVRVLEGGRYFPPVETAPLQTAVTGNSREQMAPRSVTDTAPVPDALPVTPDTAVTAVTDINKEEGPMRDDVMAHAERRGWPEVRHGGLHIPRGERHWRALPDIFLSRAKATLDQLDRDEEAMPL